MSVICLLCRCNLSKNYQSNLDASLSFSFFGIGGKRAVVSPEAKRLLLPMDTHNTQCKRCFHTHFLWGHGSSPIPTIKIYWNDCFLFFLSCCLKIIHYMITIPGTVFIGKLSGVKVIPKTEDAEQKKLPKPPKPGQSKKHLQGEKGYITSIQSPSFEQSSYFSLHITLFTFFNRFLHRTSKAYSIRNWRYET